MKSNLQLIGVLLTIVMIILTVGQIVTVLATTEAIENYKVRSPRVPKPQEYCAVYKVDKDHPATANHAGGEFTGDPEYSMACSTTPDPNTI